MNRFIFSVPVILTSIACDSPVQPSPICPEPVQLQCEVILTHPIRQTYVKRCVHPETGEITYVSCEDRFCST